LKKPQSLVFREAIRHYADHSDRLDPNERERMLEVVDRMMARKTTRSDSEVNAELEQTRAARKHGGRLHRSR
jgi:hypothetical protein